MSVNITEDLSILAHAAQEALGWLREIPLGYPIPDSVCYRISLACSKLTVLSESLTHLEKKSKGGMV